MDQAAQMRRDWYHRARRNVFHYIASWRADWDAHAFLASSQEDFATLVQPVLRDPHSPVAWCCGVKQFPGD